MSMVNMCVGGTTDTRARFVAKVDTGPVRIAYSVNADMSSPSFSASTPVTLGVAKVEVTGLSAGTRYHWQVEDNSVLDTSVTGTFRTHPAAAGQPGSYTMAVSGDSGLSPEFPGDAGGELDANRLSNHPIFETIRGLAVAGDWLYHVNLGDWGYPNWGDALVDNETNRRQFHDDQLAQSNQAAIRRDLPHVDVWDDHDFGANNSDGSLAGKANAAAVFRAKLPHHDLAAAEPIYRAFDACRVLHVVFDTRYERDPLASPPTMLGAGQKTWLDTTLAASSAEALVAWMPTPWMSNAAGDTWGGFQAERTEVQTIFGDNGYLDRMMMFHADVHAIGAASAAANEHGGFPVLCCASLDASPSQLSGPSFDLGFWGGRNQYGTLQVLDNGADVALVGAVWQGATPYAWTQVSSGGNTRIGAGNPSHVLALT